MGSSDQGNVGSPGGAAVRFKAVERPGAIEWESGVIIVNGTVSMNGAQATHSDKGGGAGGSILFVEKLSGLV